MKLHEIDGISKTRNRTLRSWFDTSPRTEKPILVDSLTVRPEVSKGERDFLRSYRVSCLIKLAARAASGWAVFSLLSLFT